MPPENIGGKKRRKKNVYRENNKRESLDKKVINWLEEAVENDKLQGTRASYDILSYQQRVRLVCAPPDVVRSPAAIVALLEESEEWAEEWAQSLYAVVSAYDAEIIAEEGQSAKRA